MATTCRTSRNNKPFQDFTLLILPDPCPARLTICLQFSAGLALRTLSYARINQYLMDQVQVSDFSTPVSPLPVEPAPSAQRKSYRGLILLAALLILAACASGVAALALLVKNLGQIPAGMTASQKVIDQFMQAGVARDVNAAYALFSKNGQGASERSKIEQIFGARNRTLFAGYQTVEINSFRFHTDLDFNLEGSIPEGTVANVAGILHYQDGRTRRIDAILEQQGGEWKIYDFDINLDPDQYNDNLES
jgi:hypothetical protein